MTAPVSARYAFHLDAAGCSGCKACQAACKDRNGLEVGRLFRRVYEVSGGSWRMEGDAWRTDAFAYNLSIACNHCEQPICVEVCPTGAMQRRENGVVWVDAGRCVGCRYCAWACPYGAPQYNAAEGTMSKCDFCLDELEQGRPPVCVAACPLRVLNVIERDEIARPQAGPQIYPLPEARLTEPALSIVPPPAVCDGRARNGRLANVEETSRAEHEGEGSLAWFTVLFQAAVGLQIGLFLAGLGGDYLRGAFSLAATLLSGAALLISLRHLGRPERAWRALTNWRTSPLSREIWLASGFFALILVSLGGTVVGVNRGAAVAAVWDGLASVFGLAAVMGMAEVYRLRTIPAWKAQNPVFLFVQTILALGALGTATLLALLDGPAIAQQAAAMIGVFSLGAILAGEMRRRSEPTSRAGLHVDPAAGPMLARRRSAARRLHVAALTAAVLGLAAPAALAPGWPTWIFALSWLFALLAELRRRALFYRARRL